jgi:hypothetical protein
MDAGGVSFGLLSAWSTPHQPALISNDEVAAWVAEHPGETIDDLRRPDG